jgi:hypothetical protein
MSDITHTVEINVPDWAWDKVRPGLRELRVLHRELGGTSRLVRNGDTVTFTATGEVRAVLHVCDCVVKVGKAIAEKREQARQRLYKGAEEEQQAFMDRLMDRLIERGLVK